MPFAIARHPDRVCDKPAGLGRQAPRARAPSSKMRPVRTAGEPKYSINPGIIPARMWKHLYIQGRTPQKAADQAAVSATTRDRLPMG
jgi:hypothetical protein